MKALLLDNIVFHLCFDPISYNKTFPYHPPTGFYKVEGPKAGVGSPALSVRFPYRAFSIHKLQWIKISQNLF